MKGRAVNSPNAVKWVNGYVSNMPDWTTARKCAATERMLYLLHRCQLALFDKSRGIGSDPIAMDALAAGLHEVLSWADLGIDERGEWTARQSLIDARAGHNPLPDVEKLSDKEYAALKKPIPPPPRVT